MSNLTNYLGCFSLEKPEDKEEAQLFLKDNYPGIVYLSDTDSYQYRGYMFDYFKAAIGFDGKNSYQLIEKGDLRNRLFSYGEKEDRWKDFLDYKASKNISFNSSANSESVIFRIFDKIFNFL